MNRILILCPYETTKTTTLFVTPCFVYSYTISESQNRIMAEVYIAYYIYIMVYFGLKYPYPNDKQSNSKNITRSDNLLWQVCLIIIWYLNLSCLTSQSILIWQVKLTQPLIWLLTNINLLAVTAVAVVCAVSTMADLMQVITSSVLIDFRSALSDRHQLCGKRSWFSRPRLNPFSLQVGRLLLAIHCVQLVALCTSSSDNYSVQLAVWCTNSHIVCIYCNSPFVVQLAM